MGNSFFRRRHLFGALSVVLLHLIAFHVLQQAFARIETRVDAAEPLVTVFIAPRIREPSESPGEASARLNMVRFRMKDLQMSQPAIDLYVDRNAAASSAAPTLIPNYNSPIGPYVKAAGLLPGEGATVVLRVEVLASGEPGDIAVDLSSGSRQVDEAAMDYARSQRWYAGREHGSPHAQWIRWGVRLQA